MKLTDQNKIDIVDLYINKKMSCIKIAKIFKVTKQSVLKILKARNIQIRTISESNRRYSLNEAYFQTIDTENKAYFLGLMYADGYNQESQYNSSISLQSKDSYILESFRNDIGYLKPLKLINKGKNRQQQYRLSITSKKISKDLAKLGCFQAKSLTLKFPTKDQVPEHLLRHFIRGYIDGDGCISFSGTCIILNITSTIMFCEKLQELIYKLFKINGYINNKKNNKKTTRTWTLWGNDKVVKILDWIYEDSNIFLTRKNNKYKMFKSATFKNGEKIKILGNDKYKYGFIWKQYFENDKIFYDVLIDCDKSIKIKLSIEEIISAKSN